MKRRRCWTRTPANGDIPLVDAAGPYLPRFLLIVDRVVIAPRARGHALGLHAAARAIRTWGDDALVVATAFPLEARPTTATPAHRR